MSTSERRILLETVARVRNGSDTHRHAPIGRHMLRIPVEDYKALLTLFPMLNSPDPFQQSAAWESFERSPFAEKYRVGKIVHGVIKNGVISK